MNPLISTKWTLLCSFLFFVIFIYLWVFYWLVLCFFRQTGNMYKNVKKKIERGVAFPTCISVNNTVCHNSPLVSDETVLEEGDVVKM